MSIRLIDTRTLRMKVFDVGAAPPYAILSHTWIPGEEISYQEMLEAKQHSTKSGYLKITMTCQLARSQQIAFAWIDTCCIDKSSSSELGESINSMFRWYEMAKVCYTYLSDLSAGDPSEHELENIEFYNRKWHLVGTKLSLKSIIAKISKVDKPVLGQSSRRFDVPVARRMSWAAHRVTTRSEDTAYCLLGIFGVNMPLVYGEGEQAFQRLQEEIIKRSNDMSIFFCSTTAETASNIKTGEVDARREEEDNTDSEGEYLPPSRLDESYPHRNLFARSPRGFIHAGKLQLAEDARYHATFNLTNNGVHFPNAALTVVRTHPFRSYYSLSLNCIKHEKAKRRCELLLRKVGPSQFVRLRHKFERFEKRDRNHVFPVYYGRQTEEIYILTNLTAQLLREIEISHRNAIRIRWGKDAQYMEGAIQAATPKSCWDSTVQEFLTVGDREFEGYVRVFPQLLRGSGPRSINQNTPSFYVTCGLRSRDARVCLFSLADWNYLEECTGDMAQIDDLDFHHRLTRMRQFSLRGRKMMEQWNKRHQKLVMDEFIIRAEVRTMNSRLETDRSHFMIVLEIEEKNPKTSYRRKSGETPISEDLSGDDTDDSMKAAHHIERFKG